MLEEADDAVLVTEEWPIAEPGPSVVYANAAFCHTTGYTLEEVVGESPRILQGPRTDRGKLDEIRAALEAERPVRTLGMVVAEGAETPRQLERVKALGCDAAQGHLFSTPLSAEAAPERPARDHAERNPPKGP